MAYTWLTNPLKKRIIRELRNILRRHPRYRDDAENVQDKYGFDERPQRGIIVNSTSSDRVRLSADNMVAHLHSFVQLSTYQNAPGTTIEWVRENSPFLRQLSSQANTFPTAPGAYLIEVTKLPDEPHQIPGEFTIDPVLTVVQEPLITFMSSQDKEAQLSHQDIYPDSLQLWLDGRHALIEGTDYTVDNDTGEIQFLVDVTTGDIIYADYRYTTPKQGPFNFRLEQFDVTAIPGAVLAFGDRAEKGDQQVVVVTDTRVETARIFGGKFETNFELLVFSRDSEDRGKMSDFVITQILEIQNILGFEGLELLDISPGGESEEVYNAVIDDYYYDSPVSVSFRVDWETHVPLPLNISRASIVSREQEQQTGYLSSEAVVDLIKAGRMSEIVGISTVIGRDVGFERVI